MRTLKRFLYPAVLIGVILITSACGSPPADDDDDDNGTPTPTASNTPEATFSWIQSNVIPRCSGPACHGSTSNNAITSYADIVGAPVSNTTGGCSSADTRVVAGDSANSILYTKLTTSPPCGSRMPLSAQPLAADELAAIQTWIDNGAAND